MALDRAKVTMDIESRMLAFDRYQNKQIWGALQ